MLNQLNQKYIVLYLTKDFYKIIAALTKVAQELINAIKECINNPPPKPTFWMGCY